MTTSEPAPPSPSVEKGATAIPPVGDVVTASQDPYQCQGCGAVRYGSHWRDKGHACWRNEDGSYEEGGTAPNDVLEGPARPPRGPYARLRPDAPRPAGTPLLSTSLSFGFGVTL